MFAVSSAVAFVGTYTGTEHVRLTTTSGRKKESEPVTLVITTAADGALAGMFSDRQGRFTFSDSLLGSGFTITLAGAGMSVGRIVGRFATRGGTLAGRLSESITDGSVEGTFVATRPAKVIGTFGGRARGTTTDDAASFPGTQVMTVVISSETPDGQLAGYAVFNDAGPPWALSGTIVGRHLACDLTYEGDDSYDYYGNFGGTISANGRIIQGGEGNGTMLGYGFSGNVRLYLLESLSG